MRNWPQPGQSRRGTKVRAEQRLVKAPHVGSNLVQSANRNRVKRWAPEGDVSSVAEHRAVNGSIERKTE
jgi:hypothetical protein